MRYESICVPDSMVSLELILRLVLQALVLFVCSYSTEERQRNTMHFRADYGLLSSWRQPVWAASIHSQMLDRTYLDDDGGCVVMTISFHGARYEFTGDLFHGLIL